MSNPRPQSEQSKEQKRKYERERKQVWRRVNKDKRLEAEKAEEIKKKERARMKCVRAEWSVEKKKAESMKALKRYYTKKNNKENVEKPEATQHSDRTDMAKRKALSMVNQALPISPTKQQQTVDDLFKKKSPFADPGTKSPLKDNPKRTKDNVTSTPSTSHAPLPDMSSSLLDFLPLNMTDPGVSISWNFSVLNHSSGTSIPYAQTLTTTNTNTLTPNSKYKTARLIFDAAASAMSRMNAEKFRHEEARCRAFADSIVLGTRYYEPNAADAIQIQEESNPAHPPSPPPQDPSVLRLPAHPPSPPPQDPSVLCQPAHPASPSPQDLSVLRLPAHLPSPPPQDPSVTATMSLSLSDSMVMDILGSVSPQGALA